MARKHPVGNKAQPKPHSRPARGGHGSSLAWWCASSSAVLVLLAVSYAAHVRFGLGHWPTRTQEDYGTLASNLHAIALFGWVFATIAAAPLWVLLQIAPRTRANSRRTAAGQVALYVGGWAALVLLGTFDPTGFAAWVMD